MLKNSRSFSLEHLFSIFLILFSYFNLIDISFITLVEHLCVGFEIVMSVGKTLEHRGDGRRTPGQDEKLGKKKNADQIPMNDERK